jgi:ribonuclease D
MSKEQQASYWDAKRLNPHQIKYAALDAAILLDLVHPVKKDVVAAGLEKKVEEGTKIIYSRANTNIKKKDEWRDDEYMRAGRAIKSTATLDELENVRAYSRQLVLPYERRAKVNALIEARRQQLAAVPT